MTKNKNFEFKCEKCGKGTNRWPTYISGGEKTALCYGCYKKWLDTSKNFHQSAMNNFFSNENIVLIQPDKEKNEIKCYYCQENPAQAEKPYCVNCEELLKERKEWEERVFKRDNIIKNYMTKEKELKNIIEDYEKLIEIWKKWEENNKDNYWKKYNEKRKEYIKQKNKKRYEEQKNNKILLKQLKQK